jgi:hypothetical protein
MPALLFTALLAFLAGGTSASADIYNRQIIPLGEREAFMGNAGTGDSADTGAVYYNPAGLAALGANRASVTGAVYLSFKTHTDATATFDNTHIPYDASGFITIPASYTAAIRRENYALAFSVLVPESLEVENKADIKTPNTTGNILQSYQW